MNIIRDGVSIGYFCCAVCGRWTWSSWRLCMRKWTSFLWSLKQTVSLLMRSKSSRTGWVHTIWSHQQFLKCAPHGSSCFILGQTHLIQAGCFNSMCSLCASVVLQVRDEIEHFGINVYQFPECDSDEEEEFKQMDKELKVWQTSPKTFSLISPPRLNHSNHFTPFGLILPSLYTLYCCQQLEEWSW